LDSDDPLTVRKLGLLEKRGFVLGLLGSQERQYRRQAGGGGCAKLSTAQRDRRARRRVIEGYQAHWHFVRKCWKRYQQARIDIAGQECIAGSRRDLDTLVGQKLFTRGYPGGAIGSERRVEGCGSVGS
jgi:hypothetical protein